MPQSLSKIYLHIIFHKKTTSPDIRPENLAELHRYIGGLINAAGSQTLQVGGTGDHVHVLCILARTQSTSGLVEEIKRDSSSWLKKRFSGYWHFKWQGGYAVFSVSQSVVENTMHYIQTQATHHRKQSSRDELLQLLQLYGIDYDERYLLHD